MARQSHSSREAFSGPGRMKHPRIAGVTQCHTFGSPTELERNLIHEHIQAVLKVARSMLRDSPAPSIQMGGTR